MSANEACPCGPATVDLGRRAAHHAGFGAPAEKGMETEPHIEVDHGPGGAPARFARPLRFISAVDLGQAHAALGALDAALKDGWWIAGYASYELGYAFEPRLASLMPERRRAPLLEFGVFDGPVAVTPRKAGAAGLGPMTPDWSVEDYRRAFGRVADYIRAGDIYQANLSMPLRGRWRGDPATLHAALAATQPVGHGALVRLPGATALSRSPELFFRLDGLGGIETAPMKGTAPRDPDPVRDAALRDGLALDAKNLAENLMIVDLLRNDIGRICEIGSVRAPDLFRLETYATVHQMVSRVTGRLKEGVRFSGVLEALFPCGSVTGAPKIRAMEVIRELEPEARGLYCGAIGWAAPDGRADFNVAIRNLTLYPDGEAVLNVGGGVVADSTALSEYEEALWKARFADLPRPISA
jgi:para-aminobenzoate synthetase component I